MRRKDEPPRIGVGLEKSNPRAPRLMLSYPLGYRHVQSKCAVVPWSRWMASALS